MIAIDYKSTGTLLGELITVNLKRKYIGDKPAFKQRVHDLIVALNNRSCIIGYSLVFFKIEKLFLELEDVLHKLWWAVEDVIKLRTADENDFDAIKAAGYAALRAFELNKQRTDLIRQIDTLLGEESITFLEKSFD